MITIQKHLAFYKIRFCLGPVPLFSSKKLSFSVVGRLFAINILREIFNPMMLSAGKAFSASTWCRMVRARTSLGLSITMNIWAFLYKTSDIFNFY